MRTETKRNLSMRVNNSRKKCSTVPHIKGREWRDRRNGQEEG